MRRRAAGLFAGFCLLLSLGACARKPVLESSPVSTAAVVTAAGPSEKPETSAEERAGRDNIVEEEEIPMLQMRIGETAVAVDWEENESVAALQELCRNGPLVISLSMYGGFEQVGSIGARLPRNDVQTTTEAGDIVLYAGDQIVVFYGSNSWAYTRLGHISDRSAADMELLLGNGDVTITLSQEAAR